MSRTAEIAASKAEIVRLLSVLREAYGDWSKHRVERPDESHSIEYHRWWLDDQWYALRTEEVEKCLRSHRLRIGGLELEEARAKLNELGQNPPALVLTRWREDFERLQEKRKKEMSREIRAARDLLIQQELRKSQDRGMDFGITR